MNHNNNQNKTPSISSSTSSNPYYFFEDDPATGIKDQNLIMENSTLHIEGDLTVEDNFSADKLTVTEDVDTNYSLLVGGKVSGDEGFTLKETILDGDLKISGTNGVTETTSAVINNISDPVAPNDALTFNYFKRNTVQSLSIYDAASEVYHDYNSRMYLGSPNSTNMSHTPMYKNFFQLDEQARQINIRQPGIYQVTYQVVRYSGDHAGSDEPTLFLCLNSQGVTENLCMSDTRGTFNGDQTVTSLYAIFSINEIPENSPLPYIFVYTTAYLILTASSISVTRFPFALRFPQED